MAKYCGKCGEELEEKSGLCPNCDAERIAELRKRETAASQNAKNGEPSAKRSAGKKGFGLKVVLAALLLAAAVGIGVFFASRGSNVPEMTVADLLPTNLLPDMQITRGYPNGDEVFIPSPAHLIYDPKNAVVFYDNVLSVYLVEDVSDAAAQELAESVDGEVAGRLQGCINALQIKVEDSGFAGLQKKAEKLMKNDLVLYASYDYPIAMDPTAADATPWSDHTDTPESDRGNEASPAGNDWWAEAIGAYSAWEYEDQCQPIKVGILDDGFDLNHEDLSGQIQLLSGYENTSADDHGTHVAGLIAAKDNDVGIKGIVSHAKLLCADWSTTKDGQKINLITNSEYRKIIKQMVEEKAQVINNSWGAPVYSEDEFIKDFLESDTKFLSYHSVKHTELYESYLHWMENFSKRNSMECAALISSMLLNDNDFLIIQGAGNGYDNEGPGYDTKLTGFFCGINLELFNHFGSGTRNKLQQHGISCQTIKDHVLIVGAVENRKNEQNQYKMADSSNFGSTVDLCAPGVDVFSTVTLRDDPIDSPKNNERDGMQYSNMSGTSMSGPIAAGSAAYIWSLFPDLTAAQVKEALCSGTSVRAYGVGDGANQTYPMLNLGESVRKLMDGRKPPEEEKDTALISLPELLDGWWDGSIQTTVAYKFQEDGTVDLYMGIGGLDYTDTYTYHLNGNHLTIERPQYPIELDFVKKDDSMKWTYGAEEGEMFFLDTGWVSSGEPSDQPEYLRRMQSTPDIRLDNKYKYAYEDGELLSELYIDSENSTPRTASLGFWHNYGNSPSHEDFNFEWEDGKWQYEVLGNRSRQMFLLEFSPVENGMQVIVTCKEGTTYAWPSMEPSKVWIEAVYKKE